MDVESKKQGDKSYIKNACKHFFVCNKLINQSLYICQFCKIKYLLNSKINHERNFKKSLYTNDIYKFIPNNNHNYCHLNSKQNIYYNNFETHLDYQKRENTNQNKKNNVLITKRNQFNNSHTINICEKYFTEKKSNLFYNPKCGNAKRGNPHLVHLKTNRQGHQINSKTNIPLSNHIQKRESNHFINTNVDQHNDINHKGSNITPPNHVINSNSLKPNPNKAYNNVKRFSVLSKIVDNENDPLTHLYNYKMCKKNNYVCYNNLNYSKNFKNQLTNNFYRQVECREMNNYNLCKVKNGGQKNNNNIKALFNTNTYLNIINKANIVVKKGNEHDKGLKRTKKKNTFCLNYNLNCNSFFNIDKDNKISNKVRIENNENCLFGECMKCNKGKEKICYIDLLVSGEKEAKKIISKAYKHKDNIKKYMYKNIEEEIDKFRKKEILIYDENLKKMEKEIKIYKNKIENNLQNYILKINDIYKNIDNISKYLIDKIIQVDLTFNSDLLKFYLPVKNIEQYIFTNSQKI
ncbi:conserved Plasmodium protein, unknown function [Plasmodium chabaudi chabaudi]|uniref:Uncharacterized protein n=1 Tax=Plasmodium chabaudi chabaudi TaxID=31271 RepID=A0A4V0K8D4_PLACU|nr:conserved Plasmodium protein, unknown function [Plasmodium chabaudi chabaudi]VTZ69296.1 conserved Plasmodium protein, unknown function [Plasmodium chabaudi chabaudi]|eukprot:XP_743802.2 conserved Plasmodium protein, unknown function [Plasmodium chabaudi chabaudi]